MSLNTVSVRFDAIGAEKVVAASNSIVTSFTKVNTAAGQLRTSTGQLANAPFAGMFTSLNTPLTQATTKIEGFRAKLSSLGSALGQQATSFGVATASVWGIYNAYDSLTKVEIRAHAATVKVSTLETSLAALIERRRLAMAKGNLTGEQMSILNEKIANTQEKLSVAQERSADVAQDVQEAWAGFLSTVGPQVVAAGSSVAQLATVFKGSFKDTGGLINTLKTAIGGLIPSFNNTKSAATILTNAITGISAGVGPAKTALTGLSASASPLISGLKTAGAESLLLAPKLGGIGVAAEEGAAGMVVMEGAAVTTGGAIKSLALTAASAAAPLAAITGSILTVGEIGQAMSELAQDKLTKADPSKPLLDRLKARKDELDKLLEGFDITQPLNFPKAAGAALARLGFSPEDIEAKKKEQKELTAQIAVLSQTEGGATITEEQYGKTLDKSNIITRDGERIRGAFADQLANLNSKTIGNSGVMIENDRGLLKLTEDYVLHNKTQVEGMSILDQATANVKAHDAALIAHQFVVDTNIKSLNTQHDSLLSQAVAVGVSDKSLIGLLDTTGLSVEQIQAMNDKITQSIITETNYTRALDNTTKHRELLNSGTAKGIVQAQQYFDNLVEGTAQEEVFTAALADGAQTLGIHADLLAFSSNTMEDLITTTYETNKAFFEQAYAAASSTKWLKDKTLIMSQLDAASLQGLRSANDWTIGMMKSTESMQSEHDQLVAIAKDLTGLNDVSGFTNNTLKELIATTYESGTAFFQQQYAAASSTKWLDALTNSSKLLDAASLKGIQSANDWTLQMALSTEETQSFHDHTLQLTADLLKVPIQMSTTTEEAQKMQQVLSETKDVEQALASVTQDLVNNSLSKLSSILTADKWKDFKNAFKDLDFGDAPKKFVSWAKDFDAGLRDIVKHGEPMQNVLDQLIVAANNGELPLGKLKSGVGFLAKEMKKIDKASGLDLSPVTDFLDRVKKMSPAEFLQNADAIQMIITAVTSGDMSKTTWDKIIKKIGDEAKTATPSINSAATSIDTLTTSLKGMKTAGTGAADIMKAVLNTEPESGGTKDKFFGSMTIEQAKKQFTDKKPPPVPVIPPPPPIIFPPPNISNIVKAVQTVEEDIGSINDFVTNLKMSFPAIGVENIASSVSTAEEDIGSMLDFVTGLKMSFPPIGLENIASSVTSAEEDIGSVLTFISGMKLAFQKPNTALVFAASTQSNAAIKSVQTFIAGMKMTFQRPNIDQIISAVGAARKAIASVQTAVSSLKLKFPKPDISGITSAVSEAQNKINSLHGTTVTNHVKTVFDKDKGDVISMANGNMFTTNGKQMFQIGDNPGGKETVAFIPHDDPGPILDRISKMFPRTIAAEVDTRQHVKLQRMSSRDVGYSKADSRVSSGPVVVNISSPIYLFPGGPQVAKLMRQYVFDEVSKYAAV